MESFLIRSVIDKYFNLNKYFITKHHLDSYNDFIDNIIPKTITSMNPITVQKYDADETLKHKIEVFVGGRDGEGIYLDHPTMIKGDKQTAMFPNDARLNDMTYGARLYCDVDIDYYNQNGITQRSRFEKVSIGMIPIMLHSKLCVLARKNDHFLREAGECSYDQGGYFIIDGQEKVVITQERNITNRMFITPWTKDDKFSYTAFIRCTSEKSSVFPKKVDFYVYANHHKTRRNAIVVQIPHIKKEIPLFILFRALGIEDDKKILSYIIGTDRFDNEETSYLVDFLYGSVTDGNICYSKAEALDYLADGTDYRIRENVEYIFMKNLFPNIEFDYQRLGIDEEDVDFLYNNNKALFLGHVTLQLVKVCLGLKKATDRDSFILKRVAVSGFMLGDIFKDFYNQFRNHLRNHIDAQYNASGNRDGKEEVNNLITERNKHDMFVPEYVTKGMIRSLKGMWGLKREQSGIVQDINRISYISYISHMANVTSPMNPEIKIRAPHKLAGNQYGITCPCNTPDGASIGLIKHFTLMFHVSFYVPSQHVIDAIASFFPLIFLEQILDSTGLLENTTQIMVNNTWIGVIDKKYAPRLAHFMTLLRRNALINIFTSVTWDIIENHINIMTEQGRCMRPLFVVDYAKQDLVLSRKPWSVKDMLTGKHQNWYLVAKGDTLSDDEFDVYRKTFRDPRDIFQTQDFEDIMAKLEENAAPLEFLDAEECNYSMIAMRPEDVRKPVEMGKMARYTHVEIHPTLMFSALASLIPFANHNDAPRNIFSCAQGKQAIGLYATNYRNRMDRMAYILHYPQQRLVKTQYTDLLRMNQLANGENLIVAIASYTGYNQEDGIICNQSAVERGMFNITAFKTYDFAEVENKNEATRIVFDNPIHMKEQGKNIEINKWANYRHLDDRGFPQKNAYIQEGDAMFGMVQVHDPFHDKKQKLTLEHLLRSQDTSAQDLVFKNKTEVADKTIEGFVDEVFVKENYSTHMRDAKLRLRKHKTIELGDKCASTHSQKGVCGMILPSTSMPFTKEGVVPDIIVNPHAFPSRKTVAHILECVLSKAAVHKGYFVDGTPFDDQSLDFFFDQLEDAGFERHGNEIMYDGVTGVQMPTSIFIGPTYYHRLKHMVSDKINYRDVGKVVGVTQQPTKGRSNQGTMRIGEMENNAIISHGLASFNKESMMERSDKHPFFLDKESGKIVGIHPKQGVYNDVKDYALVHLPYAFKLMTQELQAMCVGLDMRTDAEEQDDEEYDPLHPSEMASEEEEEAS